MYTFSGTNKIGRTELHTIPELLQQVLQLLFPYIVHIYHHRKQLMGILLRMCLSVKTDGWYQPKPVPYDLIQHFQTVINHPLPSSAFPRRSNLRCYDISFSVLQLLLETASRKQLPIETIRAYLQVSPLQHKGFFPPVSRLPLISSFVSASLIF